MSEELIKSLIIWAPTLLFVLSLLFYFLVGLIRGFRKSVILLIHAAVSLGICATIFFLIVNSENMDVTMVSIVNYVLDSFGMSSVQGMLGVSEELNSAKDIAVHFILNGMSNEEVFYYVIVDAGAYISTIAELLYRMVLFIVLFILHIFMVGFLNLIYTIFYPVRRRAKRINKAYERGEVAQPYQKRRLAGGFVGIGRGLVVNVFMLSFLGCLLFIVTGKNNPIPDRKEGTSEEISFGDDTINTIYDYYSVVCEMSDTGIFAVLNAIEDSEDRPYYFYICDLMLQGGIKDEVLEINETFYLREELGTYLGFCKDAIALVLEYAGPNTSVILSGNQEAIVGVVTSIFEDENFIAEFSQLIDEFETQPFFINLLLSATTSIINHVDLAIGKDNPASKLLKRVFDKEDGIKVTDLVTEQDIKNLFKSVLNLASTALKDFELFPKSKQNFVNAAEEKAFDVKLVMKYANVLIDNIQSLSIFGERSDVGNKLLKNIYDFCVEEFIGDSFDLPEVAATKWINEINILFDSIEPVLNIIVELYDDNADVFMDNALNMFNPERENSAFIEQEYDKLVGLLTKSNVLDLVIKIFLPGEKIDQLVQSVTGNPEACMPSSFSIASNNGQVGELEIVLTVLKDFLKNNGLEIIQILSEELSEETLTKLFDLLCVDVDPSEEVELKLIDKLLSSKVFRYALSSFLTYYNFGDFKLYVPESAADIITETIKVTDENGNKTEVTRTHKVIKTEEISILTEFVFGSPEFIFDLINNSQNIDYVELLTSEKIVGLLKDSALVQGLIASVIISAVEDVDMIVLPYKYDDPDTWIKYNEIGSLVDAILTLKEEETESGESLFNQLMAGNIDFNTILNLSQETIDSIYKSNVLKYTVSNVITSLGTDGLSIVIPGISCEKPNAITTDPNKTVNVISSKEILTIFEQIKNIIEIDSDNNITILYSEIFNNTDEILKSYTIQATIMNLLINMSEEDGAIISVPETYKSAFESFISISSPEAIKKNKWFGETTEEYELSLLVDGIKAIISDEYKDEDGNILNTFSFDNLVNCLLINKNTLKTAVKSVVLNATLSKAITSNFPTPVEVYDYNLEAIRNDSDLPEFDNLIDAIFILLGKSPDEGISIDEISNISITSISETDINACRKSKIFSTAISDIISETGIIVIPLDATEQVSIVEMKGKNVSNRILDVEGDDNLSANDEFDNFLNCLYTFLGEGEEGNRTIDISNFNTSKLVLNSKNIELITSSTIFTATLSTKITEISEGNSGAAEVLIPVDNNVVKYVEMVDETKQYILLKSELEKTLKSFVELFGTENIETKEKELNINSIKLDNFIITEKVKQDILDSAILCATISNFLIKEDFGIIVPALTDTVRNVQVIGSDSLKTIIIDSQLENFLNIAMELFGTENTETKEKELNINSINTSNFVIKGGEDGNIELLSSSNIINATITQELAKLEDLVLPIKDEEGNSYVQIISTASGTKQCGIITNMAEFLNDMVNILGGEEKEINPNNLSNISIELNKEETDGILWATISKKMLENENIFIPNEEGTIEKIDILSESNSALHVVKADLLTKSQFEEFKNTLIDLLGDGNVYKIDSLEQGINVNNIAVTKDHIDSNSDEYLFDSTVFTAIVADAIIKVEALTVPSAVKYDGNFYNKPANTKTISVEEIVALFNSVFKATNSNSLDINNFDMNKIQLSKDEIAVTEMFKSKIFAATVSNTITTSTSADSLIVVEDAVEAYSKDYPNEKYISIDKYNENGELVELGELSKLVLALTNGLGKTDASDFSVSSVSVPNPNEKPNQYGKNSMDYLLDSIIVRTIISKEIMNQSSGLDKISKIKLDANDLNICKVVKDSKSNVKNVLLISEQELKNLIIGVNELGLNNGFNNLAFDKTSILTMIQNGASFKPIAESAILRSLLSDVLLAPFTDGGTIPFYQFIRISNSSIPADCEYEYYKLNDTHSILNLNEDDIIEVYTTFENPVKETVQMFSKEDILALEIMGLK